MGKIERSDQLRELGLTPTIQRLAVLHSLENTRLHPTADQVLVTVRKKFPSISRATVYNTLEALAKAGIIQQITIDPAVARYDADIGPHAHFRCRICNTVYDVMMDRHIDLDEYIEGHHVEAVRAYAYGVCRMCLRENAQGSESESHLQESTKRQKAPKANSVPSPTESSSRKGGETSAGTS